MRRFGAPTCALLLLMGTTIPAADESPDESPVAVAVIPPRAAKPMAETDGVGAPVVTLAALEATDVELDIPLPPPVTTLATELRDPIDAFIAAKRVDAVTRAEVCTTLATAAQSNGLPVPFLIRLIWQESEFDANSVSRAGAQGMAQFMPETARIVGLDNPFDPLQAVSASARHLRDLVQQFGNLGLAAAAYNAGPQRVVDWMNNKGELPQETRSYVSIVTGQVPERWRVAKPRTTLTVPRHAPCQREAMIAVLSAARPDAAAPRSTRFAQSPKLFTPAGPRIPPKTEERAAAAAKAAFKAPRAAKSVSAKSVPSKSASAQLSAHSRVAAMPGSAAAAKSKVTALAARQPPHASGKRLRVAMGAHHH